MKHTPVKTAIIASAFAVMCAVGVPAARAEIAKTKSKTESTASDSKTDQSKVAAPAAKPKPILETKTKTEAAKSDSKAEQSKAVVTAVTPKPAMGTKSAAKAAGPAGVPATKDDTKDKPQKTK